MLRGVALRVAGVFLLVVVWWGVAAAHVWPEVFVPSPGAVWKELFLTSSVDDGRRGYEGYLLSEHLLATLRRIGLGSLYGVAGGIVLGLVVGLAPAARALLDPLVAFVRTLPPLALFSLFIIWLGFDEPPKIALLSVAALPPVAAATADAARRVRESPYRVVLPSALPEVARSVRIAVRASYTTVVSAEAVHGVPGLGGMIREAQRHNQTAVVVLGLFVIGVSGLLIDTGLLLAERLVVPWRGTT